MRFKSSNNLKDFGSAFGFKNMFRHERNMTKNQNGFFTFLLVFLKFKIR